MECKGCHEAKTILAQGLCTACYSRMRRKGTVERTNTVNRGRSCAVEGCKNPALSRGLCRFHYDEADHPLRQVWKNLRSRAVASGARYPKGWERFDLFVADVGHSPDVGYRLQRKDPTVDYSKENLHWVPPVGDRPGWSKADRTAYARAWNHRRNFGISPRDYEMMLEVQNYVCASCQQPETQVVRKTGKLRALAVDHNHKTKDIRGLLCFRCNALLGSAGDDPLILMAAAAYLQRRKRTQEVPE